MNVTKNVANAIGSQMSMQSSVFGRLGMSLHLFEGCKEQEPNISSRRELPSLAFRRAFPAMLLQTFSYRGHCTCCLQRCIPRGFRLYLIALGTNKCLQLSQKGRYEDAIARMEEIDGETLRNLRYSQYWTAQLGLLKLRRHLHRLAIPICKLALTDKHEGMN